MIPPIATRGNPSAALCLSRSIEARGADGASSLDDFVAKFRISLKEAKETRFRLRVCRRCDLLDDRFDGLIEESDELVRIIATIVYQALRRKARTAAGRNRRNAFGTASNSKP